MTPKDLPSPPIDLMDLDLEPIASGKDADRREGDRREGDRARGFERGFDRGFDRGRFGA